MSQICVLGLTIEEESNDEVSISTYITKIVADETAIRLVDRIAPSVSFQRVASEACPAITRIQIRCLGFNSVGKVD